MEGPHAQRPSPGIGLSQTSLQILQAKVSENATLSTPPTCLPLLQLDFASQHSCSGRSYGAAAARGAAPVQDSLKHQSEEFTRTPQAAIRDPHYHFAKVEKAAQGTSQVGDDHPYL